MRPIFLGPNQAQHPSPASCQAPTGAGTNGIGPSLHCLLSLAYAKAYTPTPGSHMALSPSTRSSPAPVVPLVTPTCHGCQQTPSYMPVTHVPRPSDTPSPRTVSNVAAPIRTTYPPTWFVHATASLQPRRLPCTKVLASRPTVPRPFPMHEHHAFSFSHALPDYRQLHVSYLGCLFLSPRKLQPASLP